MTPGLIGVSVATPTVSFVDRGKSAAVLTRAVGDAVKTVVEKVTKEWFEAYEAEQRRRRQRERAIERSIEERNKEDRARERRQRAATVGTGKLYAEIAGAAAQRGASITRLPVLFFTADPYRRDTTDGHRDGRWFADQVALLPAGRKIHLRGLFYRIVTAGDVRRPDGSPLSTMRIAGNGYRTRPPRRRDGSAMFRSSGLLTTEMKHRASSLTPIRRSPATAT